VCRFCKLETRAANLAECEDYCGSRTEKCPECGDYVKLKDWDEHQKMTLYHGNQSAGRREEREDNLLFQNWPSDLVRKCLVTTLHLPLAERPRRMLW